MNDDPNVRIPAQVTAAAERANEIAAQIRPTPPPPPRVTNDSNPPPQATPPAEDWEHRFNSMKGRYDASEQRMRDQSRQISELQRLLAMSASGGVSVPPAPQQPQPQPQHQAPNPDTRFGGGQPFVPQRLLTDEERKEYGEDVLNVMGRRTMEIVGPDIQRLTAVVNQLMADNAQLKAQVGGVRNVVTQDATGRFYDTLEREIPDWEVTNQDQEFVQWLGAVDPYSGRVRRDLLNEARQQNEATRVINIIKGYRQERGIVTGAAVNPVGNLQPNPGNGGMPPNGATRPSPAFELQNLAAPGRAKSGQPPTPPDKPFFTNSDISRFYADVTKGVYEGRDAEKTQLEQALFSAAKEGRILQR